MKIAVIGLGYVGCVAAAKLAQSGHEVTGVDVNPLKVKQINQGIPTVIEPGLEAAIEDAVRSGKLHAVGDLKSIADDMDIFYVCVGTPNDQDGNLNMDSIFHVVDEIKTSLNYESLKIIVIRSTVRPGTNEIISHRFSHPSVAIVSNPEFLREGTALSDWDNPSIIVIGGTDYNAMNITASLYNNIPAEVINVKPRTAEIIKYVNNSWHALKVSFANEIGRLLSHHNIDVEELITIFLADTKLNISSHYLKPGMPFGGSCLTKDLRALNHLVKKTPTCTPILASIEESNQCHEDYLIAKIKSFKISNIGFVGLSFKPDTDDLRFSPSLVIISKLLAEGFHINIYDENIYRLSLLGDNAHNNHLLLQLPEIKKLLLPSLDQLSRQCKLIILFHPVRAEIDNSDIFKTNIVYRAYKLS